MEDNKNKELEFLIDSIMKSDSLQSPSKDFTSKVMQHIDVLENKKVLAYKPLISKQVWVIISVFILAIIGYSLFGSESTNEGWFNTVNWNVLYDNNLFSQLGKINFSSTLTYALVFFGLMIGIQVSLFRKYFNQQFKF